MNLTVANHLVQTASLITYALIVGHVWLMSIGGWCVYRRHYKHDNAWIFITRLPAGCSLAFFTHCRTNHRMIYSTHISLPNVMLWSQSRRVKMRKNKNWWTLSWPWRRIPTGRPEWPAIIRKEPRTNDHELRYLRREFELTSHVGSPHPLSVMNDELFLRKVKKNFLKVNWRVGLYSCTNLSRRTFTVSTWEHSCLRFLSSKWRLGRGSNPQPIA